MQSKDELGADAEVGTASANAPEQIRVFGIAESQRIPIRCDESRLYRTIKKRLRAVAERESIPGGDCQRQGHVDL